MITEPLNRDFQLFGRLNIIGDSYYRFYKNFRINDSYLDFIGDYNNPELNIKAEYKNVSSVNNVQEIMYVVLDIKGTRYKPELTLSLRDENGGQQRGNDAQTKAISYLLFGSPYSCRKQCFEQPWYKFWVPAAHPHFFTKH